MAIKDIFKSLTNFDDNDMDEGYEENTEEVVAETKPKREAPIQRRSNDRRNSSSGTAMKVVIVRPEVFDEVAGIADQLMQGKTVVLNLETCNKDVTRRIVDFMSGAAYALSCKLKRIANNTFLIVPEQTDIAGDLSVDDFDEQNYFL